MTNVSIYTFVLSLMAAIASVNSASMSFQEWLCEKVHPELTRCQLRCNDGKVWRDGCPICACRSTLCQQKNCYFGQRCAIVQQQTGRYYNQLSDVAICEPDARSQHIVKNTTASPVNPKPTEFLGSCDFQGHCDSNGKCSSPDAVCRSDGLCCKVKRPGYNLGGVTNGMAKCMEEPEIGACRGLGIQYVFNKSTGKCQTMMFGGCVKSANSFPTMRKCQETCEHPCQKPRTLGRCRASIPRYYFNENTEACEAFDLGGCASTDNYFMTPWDCETHCKGLKQKSKPEHNSNRGQIIPTPSTPVIISKGVDANQSERKNLRDRIISGFRGQPDFANRGKPSGPVDGKINFHKPRPQPGKRVFVIDENGNVVYVNNPTFVPKPIPTTAVPNILSNKNNNNNNNNIGGNGDAYSHLGDRIRSAHQMVNGFQRDQVNYNKPRNNPEEGSVPRFEDRRIRTGVQGRTYQSSVDAIRQYLTSG